MDCMQFINALILPMPRARQASTTLIQFFQNTF